MNQKRENVFERPKKKPVRGAQEKGNMVCKYSRQLAEPGRPNKGFFFPRAMDSHLRHLDSGFKMKGIVDILDLENERGQNKQWLPGF